eukprot:gene1414-432_t
MATSVVLYAADNALPHVHKAIDHRSCPENVAQSDVSQSHQPATPNAGRQGFGAWGAGATGMAPGPASALYVQGLLIYLTTQALAERRAPPIPLKGRPVPKQQGTSWDDFADSMLAGTFPTSPRSPQPSTSPPSQIRKLPPTEAIVPPSTAIEPRPRRPHAQQRGTGLVRATNSFLVPAFSKDGPLRDAHLHPCGHRYKCKKPQGFSNGLGLFPDIFICDNTEGEQSVTKVLIVAHPDDESIFAYKARPTPLNPDAMLSFAHACPIGSCVLALTESPGSWLVICLTTSCNPTRRREFFSAIQQFKALGIMMHHDTRLDVNKPWSYKFNPVLAVWVGAILRVTRPSLVLTHQRDGEYGHMEHVATFLMSSHLVGKLNQIPGRNQSQLATFGNTSALPLGTAMAKETFIKRHYPSRFPRSVPLSEASCGRAVGTDPMGCPLA